MYTFEPKRDPDWKPYVGDPFDISLDPVRMTEMAAGALMFLRGDVRPARQTVARTYSTEQVLESRRLPRTEQPYFTPGFPLALPLEHGVRIQSLAGAPDREVRRRRRPNPIVSDTKELAWYTVGREDRAGDGGHRSHAGADRLHQGQSARRCKNLCAEIANNFATIVLSLAG